MNKLASLRFCIAIIFLAICATSCQGRINGSLRADGSADLELDAALEPQITLLIQTLARVFGNSSPQGPLIDGPAIGAAMATAPGVASASLRNVTPTAIAGTVRLSQVNAFLASPSMGGTQFIQYSPTGSLRVSIDKQSGTRLLTLFTPEVTDYLLALMAPVATGEELAKEEYLTLVEAIYGKAVADEIDGSQVQLILELPRPVRTIRGGTYQGRRAQFSIALADLLVLERPLVYEVTW